MNSQQEIEYKQLIRRARRDYRDAIQEFRHNPGALMIDEPLEEDYLVDEIHEYIIKKYGIQN
jgi:hypothetical protein